MSKEFNYCRPSDGVYCVECCRGRGCVNLVKLPDETSGCAGHDGKLLVEGYFDELESCVNMFCLREDQKNNQNIKKKILELSNGEFRMSGIIRTVLEK